MKRRAPITGFLALSLVLLLSACGPLVGQLIRTTEGTTIRDISGTPAGLKAGAELLILSPFPKTKDAFYIVRGEDETNFASEFNLSKLFKAQARFEPKLTGEMLSDKTPAQLKSDLALDAEPDILLTGTLLRRKTIVAPARGVVMDVAWRLTFRDLRGGGSWVIEADSKELAESCIPRIVEEIGKRLAR